MLVISRWLLALCLSASPLAGQPRAPDDVLRSAVAHHQAGDYETAIQEYRDYLTTYPDSVQVHSNLGAALAHLGRFPAAIDEYNIALKAQPDNAPVKLNLALAYYKIGQTAQSAELFQALHQVDPANRQITFLLAGCAIRLGNYQNAIDLLTPYQDQLKEDQALNYLLGTALLRAKQTDRGSIILDRILRRGDSAEARLLLGTTRLNGNDFAGARDELSKAVELNPKLPDAHAYYGLALMGTGDTESAAKEFRKELEIDPANFTANLELGVLSKQDHNYDEALPLFRHALEIRPGDAGVRYQIATIELAQGKTADAQQTLETLVRESPQFTEAHVTLATVYYRLKRKEDGDRERGIVRKLTEEAQAKQPGANLK
jgi:tetratricopeptide (TPR) repeat protein